MLRRALLFADIKRHRGRFLTALFALALASATLYTAFYLEVTRHAIRLQGSNDLVFGKVRFDVQKYIAWQDLNSKLRSLGVTAVPILIPYTYWVDSSHRLIYVGLDTGTMPGKLLHKIRVSSGRLPKLNEEIAISRAFAAQNKLSVGKRMIVPRYDKAVTKRIVGLVEDSYSEASPGYIVFTLSGLQRDFNLDGLVNRIELNDVPDRLGAIERITGVRAKFISSTLIAPEMRKGGTIPLSTITYGAFTLFIAAFVVYNTFSLTVTQERRELGLLRLQGATRRWLKRFMMMKAICFAVVASCVGILIGMLFVTTLHVLGPSFLQQSPMSANVSLFSATPIAITFMLTLVTTLLAMLRPARKASSVQPLEAVSYVPQGSRRRVRYNLIALGMLAIIFGFISFHMFGTNPEGKSMAVLAFFGIGFYLLGLLLLLANVVPMLTRALIRVQRRRPALALAAPSFATSGGAHIGAALSFLAFAIVFIGLITGSTSVFESKVLSHKQEFPSEYGIDSRSKNYYASGFIGDLRRVIQEFADVEQVTALRIEQFAARTSATMSGITVVAVNPGAYSNIAGLHSKDRRILTALGVQELAVTKQTAKRLDLRAGDELVLSDLAGNDSLPVRVAGVVGIDPVQGNDGAFVTDETGNRLGMIYDRRLLIKARPSSKLESDLRSYLSRFYPQLRLISDDGLRRDVWGDVLTNEALPLIGTAGILYLVSFLSLSNTMLASVWHRRREIAMLRALGATRRQIGHSVALEGIICAITGTSAGLIGGIFMVWVLIKGLASAAQQEGHVFVFSLSWWAIALILLLAVVSAVVASLVPARFVGRMAVIQEVRNE
ncbi:MAG: FtsX-like permease family protein [Bacillota bacterium]